MLWVGYYSPLNVRADHVRYRGRIAGRFDDDYVVRRHIAAKAFNRSRRMSIRPSRLIPKPRNTARDYQEYALSSIGVCLRNTAVCKKPQRDRK